MFKIGTVCMKIAGRDAGNLCVIVEEEKDGFVLIEGAVRRRKCNTRHLEPTGNNVKVAKGATHAAVMKALGLDEKKSKPKKAAARPRKIRKVKPKVEKPAKKTPVKKEEKIPEKKEKALAVDEKKEESETPKAKAPAKKAPAKKTVKKK